MSRVWLSRSHSGVIEAAGLALLYVVYELVRGFGGVDLRGAQLHTADIVALERHLHLFGEHAVQEWVTGIRGLPALLGFAYLGLHFAGTGSALIWVHRARRAEFALVRTTLIVSTAFALAGYVLFPAAPPRLAGIGFSDTVSSHAGLNLSSDALGSLYNPVAAVPSLHFGYALIVGWALAALAERSWVRIAGALYPAIMLVVIVGTGNHFFFDAAAGGLVVAAGWLIARALVRPVPPRPAAVKPADAGRTTAHA